MADLVVFGGSGFIGSAIANEAANRGLSVACVSRHGRPVFVQPRPNVVWITGDALDPSSYRSHLEKTKAVVVSIGAPPIPYADEEKQITMNGRTNAEVINTANAANVKRVVIVNALMPQWCPAAYMRGKAIAEEAARNFAAQGKEHGAVVLKPAAVYGTRHTAGGWPIPLWLAMAPVSHALRIMPTQWLCEKFPYALGGALAPPVHVRSVAAAAVDAATMPEYGGKLTVLENDKLLKFSGTAA